MASNAKTRTRKLKRLQRDINWRKKFQTDVSRVVQPGEELRTHFIGSGKEFTRKA